MVLPLIRNPTGPFPDGLVFSNNYEIADTDTIAVLVTKFWFRFRDYPKLNDDLLATADYAKLIAIILADGTYLRSIWGKITADPAYRPIYWK